MLRALLVVHVVAGSAALLSMIVPMVTRKGAATHRRAGWVFVSGMATVSVTAFLLAASRALTDHTAEGRQGGIFLFYVAILTAAGVSAGVRVLRAKHRTGAHTGAWDIGIAAALVVASLAMAAYGFATGIALFRVFPLVGLLAGGGQLAYWLRAPSHPMHWWFEHMSQMLGSSIAAVTAFLVVNAERVGLPADSLAVWIGPALIGAPAIIVWTTYYRRLFKRAPGAAVGRVFSDPPPAGSKRTRTICDLAVRS